MLEGNNVTFIDFITYRGTVIALNVIAILVALFLVIGAVSASSRPSLVLLVPILAPASGILAFATPRRRVSLLAIAGVVNAMTLMFFALVILFSFIGLPGFSPIYAFGILLAACATPFVTSLASFLRWKQLRRVAL